MAAASPEARNSASASPWLYGRAIDLLIGCCGIYTLSLPFLLVLSIGTGIQSWSIGLTIVLGITINAPHYGATLVRLYEREQDRRKYVFFTLYVTLAVAALFVIATHNIWLASALITAYVTWSPWHFSAQNYGLLLMFMRREGVDFDDTTKRLFYASFIFATAMSIEGVQATSSDLVFAPATFPAPGTPQVFQLAFLQEYAVPILWTLGVLYAGSLGAALVRLRGSGLRLVGPATLMILTQAFFTSVPVVAGRIYTNGEINLAFAPVWISMAHSAQYLWVSAYFAKRSDAQQGSARFLGKSFLAGSGITILPALLFAPAILGNTPWDAGLAGLVFAMVNLHHFIMDGAIWKLRDGRVSNILLRSADASSESNPKRSGSTGKWVSKIIWSACALSVLVPVLHLYETEVHMPNAKSSDDINNALERIRWLGRESISLHNYVGAEYSKLQQPGLAIEQFESSIEVFPTPDAYAALGHEYRRTGVPQKARDAYSKALAIDADAATALLGYSASLAIDEPHPTEADRSKASQMLKRVLEIYPGQSDATQMLRQLRRHDAKP
ncbi:MAG: tetratricopeptide repeat protein [bacterium]|jgi:hypothetical protein